MTRQLKPWAYGPFEILLHAEMHYRTGNDVDRHVQLFEYLQDTDVRSALRASCRERIARAEVKPIETTECGTTSSSSERSVFERMFKG